MTARFSWTDLFLFLSQIFREIIRREEHLVGKMFFVCCLFIVFLFFVFFLFVFCREIDPLTFRYSND